jgi:hypothetical protein
MRLRVLTLLALTTCFAWSQGNLLSNPRFEGRQDLGPAGWATVHSWYEGPKGSGLASIEVDSGIFRAAGWRSLRIIGSNNRGISRQVLAYRRDWGGRMRLSGWIRLRDTGTARAESAWSSWAGAANGSGRRGWPPTGGRAPLTGSAWSGSSVPPKGPAHRPQPESGSVLEP